MKDQENNYQKINKASWNHRTEIHYTSDFYDNDSFIKGRSSLNEIELNILGDIKGKSVLHLQCHFGQDSISLARLGAKVCGVDISDKAIERARELSKITKSDCEFICCDIYDLPKLHDKKYDLVFSTYGTIGWMPDMDRWASVVSHFLKPAGELLLVEFHPYVWMFDELFSKIEYNYFNDGAIIENEGSYTVKNDGVLQEFVSWNHSLSEVMNALLQKNLSIKSFQEYDYSPYDCFKETEEFEKGKFRIKHLGNKIPMVYGLLCGK